MEACSLGRGVEAGSVNFPEESAAETLLLRRGVLAKSGLNSEFRASLYLPEVLGGGGDLQSWDRKLAPSEEEVRWGLFLPLIKGGSRSQARSTAEPWG